MPIASGFVESAAILPIFTAHGDAGITIRAWALQKAIAAHAVTRVRCFLVALLLLVFRALFSICHSYLIGDALVGDGCSLPVELRNADREWLVIALRAIAQYGQRNPLAQQDRIVG